MHRETNSLLEWENQEGGQEILSLTSSDLIPFAIAEKPYILPFINSDLLILAEEDKNGWWFTLLDSEKRILKEEEGGFSQYVDIYLNIETDLEWGPDVKYFQAHLTSQGEIIFSDWQNLPIKISQDKVEMVANIDSNYLKLWESYVDQKDYIYLLHNFLHLTVISPHGEVVRKYDLTSEAKKNGEYHLFGIMSGIFENSTVEYLRIVGSIVTEMDSVLLINTSHLQEGRDVPSLDFFFLSDSEEEEEETLVPVFNDRGIRSLLKITDIDDKRLANKKNSKRDRILVTANKIIYQVENADLLVQMERTPGNDYKQWKITLLDKDENDLTENKMKEILDSIDAEPGALLKDFYLIEKEGIDGDIKFYISTEGDLIMTKPFEKPLNLYDKATIRSVVYYEVPNYPEEVEMVPNDSFSTDFFDRWRKILGV